MPDHAALLRVLRVLAEIRYRIRWIRWFLTAPVSPGDPLLGNTREERNRNIRLMLDRWFAREPRRLPTDGGGADGC